MSMATGNSIEDLSITMLTPAHTVPFGSVRAGYNLKSIAKAASLQCIAEVLFQRHLALDRTLNTLKAFDNLFAFLNTLAFC